MRSRVQERRGACFGHTGDGGKDQDAGRGQQDRQDRHLHLEGIDLLTQVFGRAPDHQPEDEHGYKH